MGTFGLLALVAVGIAGCNPWDRVKNAKSAAVVAYEYEDGLVQFDSGGNVLGSSAVGGDGIGAGEAANVLGGLFSGKAVENAQGVAAARQKNEAATQESYDRFKENLNAKFPDLLSKARITVVKFDPLPSADLGQGSIAKTLTSDSGADCVVVLHTTIGYVKEEGLMGLSKTYQLGIKTKVTIGDKEGKMGEKEFFALSTAKRSADGGLPAFPADDFNSTSKQLIGKIQSAILEVKLQ